MDNIPPAEVEVDFNQFLNVAQEVDFHDLFRIFNNFDEPNLLPAPRDPVGGQPQRRRRMDEPGANILPDPGNFPFNLPAPLPDHLNQEADNIANRLQDIPIPFPNLYQPPYFFGAPRLNGFEWDNNPYPALPPLPNPIPPLPNPLPPIPPMPQLPVPPVVPPAPRLHPYAFPRPLSPAAQAPPVRNNNNVPPQNPAHPAAYRLRHALPNPRAPPVPAHRPRPQAHAPAPRAPPIRPPPAQNNLARNVNPIPPNHVQPPIIPLEPVVRPVPMRFPRRERERARPVRNIQLPRLPNESNDAYRSRNQYFNGAIMPRVRERHRLTKEFVRWVLPGIIATPEEDAARINQLRGEVFDLIKFIEAEDLLEANLPYEEQLHRRFRVTQEDMLLELLAEQAEQFCREDNIGQPRERSPSPELEREGNETGQQFFRRVFGDLAGRADVSPAPGDVPENLEEALALLARVPNGRPQPAAEQFDRDWFDRQCSKIRRVLRNEQVANARSTKRLRDKAAREEALQLGYEIITMPLNKRKRLWHKALKRCAGRENIELRDPFGPNMVIPPPKVANQAQDTAPPVITLGDSDDEDEQGPAQKKQRQAAPHDPIVHDPDAPGPSTR